MNSKSKLCLIALAIVSLTFSSCKSEDPVPENDGELITDVTLTFQELDEYRIPIGSPFSFKASDSQGIDFGGSLLIEDVVLAKGKMYSMEIELYNAILNEDITVEVREEADKHQFYFLGTAFSMSRFASYFYNDLYNGRHLGLEGVLSIDENPSSTNANLQIILRHDLNKDFIGADNPNFVDYPLAGGETDLLINFPVIVE
ncbi:hypothetical protein U3A58_09020 [Algoriphagus sp. C2-6-M1]|uniref:hypothetical protein n=1 Tax=Algoriphagus persicinus TaxID=3108754 RepID=UPI002B3DCEA4|nr:hypothetical protein [Algoriphagus sp. C2-6-M1]MEB2780534.1 hypothetical protein [Algoriphagus sp. C2-6-M1]